MKIRIVLRWWDHPKLWCRMAWNNRQRSWTFVDWKGPTGIFRGDLMANPTKSLREIIKRN